MFTRLKSRISCEIFRRRIISKLSSRFDFYSQAKSVSRSVTLPSTKQKLGQTFLQAFTCKGVHYARKMILYNLRVIVDNFRDTN